MRYERGYQQQQKTNRHKAYDANITLDQMHVGCLAAGICDTCALVSLALDADLVDCASGAFKDIDVAAAFCLAAYADLTLSQDDSLKDCWVFD